MDYKLMSDSEVATLAMRDPEAEKEWTRRLEDLDRKEKEWEREQFDGLTFRQSKRMAEMDSRELDDWEVLRADDEDE